MEIRTVARAVAVDRKGRIHMIGAKAKRVLQLPGGGVKPGEDPALAVVREVREETGYRKVEIVRSAEPLLVRRAKDRYEIAFAYLVKISKKGKRTMTRRERQRGLRVVRFTRLADAIAALMARISRYGRSAVRRDRALIRALGLKRSADLAYL